MSVIVVVKQMFRYFLIIAFSVAEKEVKWEISLDGKLSVSWLSRISFFAEENPVDLLWSTDSESGRAAGSVKLSMLDSLILGKTYNISLWDTEDSVITNFNFEACE